MSRVHVSLRELEYFVDAAQAGTMSAAANTHGISQSAVSLAISHLERSIGAQLFARQRGRGLTLTASGRRILLDARELLRQAESLEAGAKALGEEIAGELLVGCFSPLAPFMMPRLLAELPAKYPTLSLDFVEGSVADLHMMLLEGRCEVAVMFDMGLPQELRKTVIQSARPYALLPAGHRLARRRSIRLSELGDEPMVHFDMPVSSDYFLGLIARAGFSPRIRHRSRSLEAVRSLVAHGEGYSLLLQRPKTNVSFEGLALAACDIADDVPSIDMVVVQVSSVKPTRRAEAFVGFCRQLFGNG